MRVSSAKKTFFNTDTTSASMPITAHLERLQRQEAWERHEAPPNSKDQEVKTVNTKSKTDFFSDIKPSYFNTGCCCYDDGDITGIEIVNGNICLIKWEKKEGAPFRVELEKKSLEALAKQLN